MISFTVALLFLITACTGAGGNTKSITDNGNDTTEEVTTAQNADNRIDFSVITVEKGMVVQSPEDLVHVADGNADFYVSQRPSVAEVDSDGNITVKGKGVTLIGFEKDGEQKAWAICVPEGNVDISSYSSAMLFEVGKSFMHTSPVGNAKYETSDSSVVNVDNAPRLTFDRSGYAYITVSNVSRPFFYSFIVYDRETE